jgi:hypothetical protein
LSEIICSAPASRLSNARARSRAPP